MGQGTSREKPTVEFNGVRFSQSLGNKLGLIQSKLPILEESTRHDGVGQTTASIHIKAAGSIAERVDNDVKLATEKLISKSRTLSKALETSKYINDLLLAREEEEMGKIEQMSKEILEKEAKQYQLNVDVNEVAPCGEYEEKVLRCYLENESDPLKCKDVVENYAACSRQQFISVV